MRSSQPGPNLNRVRFSLRAAGVKPQVTGLLRSGIHTRGYLPHVKCEGAWYFVTFRLADSLPREVLLKVQNEAVKRLRSLSASEQPPSHLEQEIARDAQRKIERYLDASTGECYLRRPEIAEVVMNAIRFFEGERYLLKEWVIMPNHVHVVLCPLPNYTLSDILQSWKRFTSRKANRLLNRVGEAFWQPESFDHWIRNEEEMSRIGRYVVDNPVKANLCRIPEEWLWSSVGRNRRL